MFPVRMGILIRRVPHRHQHGSVPREHGDSKYDLDPEYTAERVPRALGDSKVSSITL